MNLERGWGIAGKSNGLWNTVLSIESQSMRVPHGLTVATEKTDVSTGRCQGKLALVVARKQTTS